jgi:hypothetical protein
MEKNKEDTIDPEAKNEFKKRYNRHVCICNESRGKCNVGEN